MHVRRNLLSTDEFLDTVQELCILFGKKKAEAEVMFPQAVKIRAVPNHHPAADGRFKKVVCAAVFFQNADQKEIGECRIGF